MEITELPNAEYALLPEPRPHRYPDREPSDVCYIGLTRDRVRRPCRCQPCRDAHAAATRERLQAQRTGLWVDARRAIRTSTFLAEVVELAERVPELYALLRKHGHVPPVIRVQAEPVIAGELPPGAPDGTGSEPAEPEPVAPAEARLGGPDPSGNPPDPAAVMEPLSDTAKRLLDYFRSFPRSKFRVSHAHSFMPTILAITSEHFQTALAELETAGLLVDDGTYLSVQG